MSASRRGFRVIHFSVQENHLHLVVEADDPTTFTSGVRGLAIRIARAVNRALGRRGAVWGDRYHARSLGTPRAVRHALVYVLMNRRKHRPDSASIRARQARGFVDGECRSGLSRPRTRSSLPARVGLVGWRRYGLIGFDERPR